jgi:hypothetical protein
MIKTQDKTRDIKPLQIPYSNTSEHNITLVNNHLKIYQK